MGTGKITDNNRPKNQSENISTSLYAIIKKAFFTSAMYTAVIVRKMAVREKEKDKEDVY